MVPQLRAQLFPVDHEVLFVELALLDVQVELGLRDFFQGREESAGDLDGAVGDEGCCF